MFPSSYIDVKVPIRESSPSKNQQTSTPIQKNQPTARALFNFVAEAPEDLSLQVNFEIFCFLFFVFANWSSIQRIFFFVIEGKRYYHRSSTHQRGMVIRSYWLEARPISC